MSFSLYDGVMLAIVVFAVIHGAVKGMAWQLAPIASLVLGYLFAMPLSAATAPWFGQPPLNRVFSLIVMYMLVSLGVYLVARSLRESIEKAKLAEFDRHLGALLGGVKGVLFTTVLTVGLLSVSPTAAGFIIHSESHTIASRIIDVVCPLLPQDVHRVIDPYLAPLHDHANDRPAPFADDKEPRKPHDVARHDDDGFTPRTRRRQPIYEDDPLPKLPPKDAPRRLLDDEADPSEGDDDFGVNPNRL
jgi:membrane protein required for colicin V production